MTKEMARIELYVNDAAEPIRVLVEPPFTFNMDTSRMPDGDNELRVVAVYADGSRREAVIPFSVANEPVITVEGLGHGARVHGVLDLELVIGDADRPRPAGRIPVWLSSLALVVALSSVWVLFAFSPSDGKKPDAGALHQSVARQDTTIPAATPVDTTMIAEGMELYDEHCSTCHRTDGEGIAGAFPPLSGNPDLSDLKLVVDTIHSGHSGVITVRGRKFDQTMPAIGAGLSAEQVAAVATYVRNRWGNAFGGASGKEVSKILAEGVANRDTVSTTFESAPVDRALLAAGQDLYMKNCATCHQPDGSGVAGAFPPLAGNPDLVGVELVVDTVHGGHSGVIKVNGKTFDQTMPAIGAGFSAEQLTAVATYVRNSWKNTFGGVSKEEVTRILSGRRSHD